MRELILLATVDFTVPIYGISYRNDCIFMCHANALHI